MKEPPFTVQDRPSTARHHGKRKAPQLIDAIIETATSGKAVFVLPREDETLLEARARVATVYQTVRREGFAMRTSISKEPPGIYAWAERKEAETK